VIKPPERTAGCPNLIWELSRGRREQRDCLKYLVLSLPAQTLLEVRLDKGTIPEQAQFFSYLKGYVAFYARDYKTALEELTKANQNDPFIQCLIGQTYEKLADKEKALEYYRKASTASSQKIADVLQLLPSEIVFISDVSTELDAAKSAGMHILLCVRPGNRPQPASTHRLIQTLDEVFP